MLNTLNAHLCDGSTRLNHYVHHVIWVEKIWDIGCWVLGKTLVLKTLDAVATEESKFSESCYLITQYSFQDTSPGIFSNLVMYWPVNNILYGVDLIQLGINLQYIPTPFRL